MRCLLLTLETKQNKTKKILTECLNFKERDQSRFKEDSIDIFYIEIYIFSHTNTQAHKIQLFKKAQQDKMTEMQIEELIMRNG